jgi:hypothetical protein
LLIQSVSNRQFSESHNLEFYKTYNCDVVFEITHDTINNQIRAISRIDLRNEVTLEFIYDESQNIRTVIYADLKEDVNINIMINETGGVYYYQEYRKDSYLNFYCSGNRITKYSKRKRIIYETGLPPLFHRRVSNRALSNMLFLIAQSNNALTEIATNYLPVLN